jgi:transcriptional regulator with XRE-family HTH domain
MTNLKNNRIAYGLTQKQLADRSRIDIRMIQQYEQGARDINKAQALTVYRLSEALGCTVKDILELDQ